MYFPDFLRRKLRQSLREPRLNMAYRATGFAILVGFGSATLVAVYYPGASLSSPILLAVVAGFGAVILLTGFASSEAWEWAMSRVNYQVYATPYGRRKLTFFTGTLALAIAVVVLALLLFL